MGESEDYTVVKKNVSLSVYSVLNEKEGWVKNFQGTISALSYLSSHILYIIK